MNREEMEMVHGIGQGSEEGQGETKSDASSFLDEQSARKEGEGS